MIVIEAFEVYKVIPQTITVMVPDGWEIVECDAIEPTDETALEIVRCVAVKLRRVHEWPEWLLEFARLNRTKWLTVDSERITRLSVKEPEPIGTSWFAIGTMISIPNSWAPQHAPEKWQERKWRLPL